MGFLRKRTSSKWLVDFTYIPTLEGWLYLACVMDICSRRIIGWTMGDQPTSALVSWALELAVGQRATLPELHHFGQGTQYASHDFLVRLNGVTLSMSGAGSCYDNALQESVWSTLKTEAVHGVFPSRAIARQVVFEYIECWYVQLVVCVEVLTKLVQLWELSSDQDKQELVRSLFEELVFDLDKQQIVGFKLKP